MTKDAKTVDMTEKKMTPEQEAAAMKKYQKQQAVQLSAYKKQLRENNELKKLQVEEIELNIRYYQARKNWKGMFKEVEEFEAQEKAEYQEAQRKQAELIKKQQEEAEKAVAAEKPEIVIPKVGKARDK